ncbi:glyceraldehyde 3-phosphate dehydrogenase NAD-binding domain-containing protein [Sedimentitalea sp. JM2-8]|uniref:Glyceraldehyde 3-phosphate dehydrogenase NAD-binding domain-containing protein n=1 Tax=Sedimentitalea xiamensis TaxID=3050037 RepID=A0ABT7FB84_9RHOB|nr:glyceraldehyde 3-phosphate dehydrogenase NAD-binding domain-containing protein [Sedimentitalea xiamensis]MDK3072303.1 glyceraldehyde 3-phosphate dehydrogenase NAD-binding domain-containing protein [Sedimentitalea xiamensis]
MRIAINGFGRIGRTILRQVLCQPGRQNVEVVLINDIAPVDMLAYLFEYDSTFGPLPLPVSTDGAALTVGDRQIPTTHCEDLTQLDLAGVDVVLECTGIARSSDVAERGLTAGARSVLISGPSPAAYVTVVLGANDSALGAHRIVSNASCTTNAVAPLLAAVESLCGIETAHMTTIHCYTNSQPMVDAPRGDPARSRAGALSMVPTTTSATHLIDEVLPHLAGRISGAAVRVPVASVSAVDLVVRTARDIDDARLRADLREATDASPVLGWTDLPLVSSDLRARPESLVIAGPETGTTGPRQLRLFGWYDNEWGFSARMLDVAARMAERGTP